MLVYVPAVIRETPAGGDDDLYVLSRFFAINSEEAAAVYAAEFETNELAKELIRVYNMALEDYKKLEETEKKPYFTQRLNEADRAEIRAEAWAEAWDKAVAETWDKSKKDFTAKLKDLLSQGLDVDAALQVING